MRGRGIPGLRRALPVLVLGVLLGALVVDFDAAGADPSCAAPPTGLVSALSDDASAVVLSWEAPSSCTPDEYAVYRRDMDVDGSRMAVIATVDGAALSYSDEDVTAGATYRYRLRSNDQGTRSGRTEIVVPEAEPDPTPTPQPGEGEGRSVLRTTPALSTAAVDGTSLVLTYDVALNESSVPAVTAYSVSVNSGAGVDPLSVAVSGMTVTLGLATAVVSTDTVTVSYTVPGTNPLQDSGGMDAAAALTNQAVTNNTANAAPTFNDGTTATRTLAENSTAGENVGDAVTATDSDSTDTLTYTLGGTDASSFTVDSSSGQIKTGSGVTYNFEVKDSYTVVVSVRDSKDAAGTADSVTDDSITVTINLTNVDEDGAIAISGTETGGSTLTATLSDPDGPTSSVTWQWQRADMSAGPFSNISGATAVTYTLVAADVGKYLRAVASSYTDPHGTGKTATSPATGQIMANNSEPSFGAMTASRTVPENTTTVTNVGDAVTATDSDSDTLTYTLSGTDASSFTVDSSGQIKTGSGVTYNFEDKDTYTVVVNVSDGKDAAGNSDSVTDDSITVTITLGNLDEAGTVSVSGTLTGGEDLTASLSDPDGMTSSVSWQWRRASTSTGTFSNISGATSASYTLVAADVGNYLKARASYTDPQGSGKTATSAATGQVGSANSEPEFTATTTDREVPENSAVGTNVGNPVATTDGDSDPLTYTLTGTDAGDFTIDASSGQIKTKTGITYNYEATKNSYTVVVNVRDNKDAAGNTNATVDDSITVTIDLTNVNEAPTITSRPDTQDTNENTLTVSTIAAFAATDPDAGTTFAWSVESADDGGKFDINSNGELTFKVSPNFEAPTDVGGDAAGDNIYVVTVKVTDDGTPAGSDTFELAVTVLNVNEAPAITTTGTAFTAPSFDENATGTIATYEASDEDTTDDFTTSFIWTLEGNDKDAFTLTKTVDEKALLTFDSPPNFEMPTDVGDMMNNYDISVKVTDNGIPRDFSSLSDDLDVVVTVNDLNETPVISGTAGPSFAEIEFDVDASDLTAANYEVGTYTAVDDDRDTVTWGLGGADAGDFTIGSSSGVLSFAGRPNFEIPADADGNNIYVVEVRADDGQGESNSVGTYAVTVTVTNVDETPEITGGSDTPSFAEIEYNALSADLVVETYTARDEEIEAITWSRTGTDAGDFTIDSNSGVLSFAQRPNYEMPADDDTDNVYEIIVRATDATPDANTREYPVTITVTNVNETPEFINLPAFVTYDETEYDSGLTAADLNRVSIFNARDEEQQGITWSLDTVNPDENGDLFTLVPDPVPGRPNQVLLRWAAPPDFETPLGKGDFVNQYILTVEASDGTNKSTTLYRLIVSDVNEQPEFTGTKVTSRDYDENDTAIVAAYSARDEEGGVTWSLMGADSGDFDIDSGGTVTFANTPDWEEPDDSNTDNTYNFIVVATDIQSRSNRRAVGVAVVVTLMDVEEPGVIEVSNLNPAVGDLVRFTLTDPDGGIVTAPELPPDGFQWVIQKRDSSWVQLARTNNLETFYEYLVDEDDSGDELRAVITAYQDRRGPGKSVQSEITDPVTADPIVNAPPRLRSGASQSIPETDAGEDVGERLVATDRDNDGVTFAITGGNGSDLFEIDPSSGQLRTTQVLDFETTTGLVLLTVTLSDGKDADGNTEDDPVADASVGVSVSVVDVEEEGIVTLSHEEPAVGNTVQATLADGDGSITGLTWRWARSTNGRTNWANITGATSSSYAVTQADADFFLRATASYTDNRGAGKQATTSTTERVFGENQRPTFPSTENGRRSVPENTRASVSIGAPVAASDPENQRLTYSLSGAGADSFSIVSSTGQLRTKEPLDFEGQASFTFTVEVHDGQDGDGNASTTVDDTVSVTVTLENVEEPGTVTLETLTQTVQAGVPVAAELSDDDIPTGTTWQWWRSPNGRSGWVSIAGATSATYTPTLVDAGNYIRASASYSDGYGANKTASAVSSRVGDPPPVNSAPAFPTTDNGQRSVPEDAGGGDPVGALVFANDLDNDQLTYSLSGTDAASFTIDPSSGQLRVAQGVELDFEGKRSYRVTVSASDGADQNDDPDDVIDDTINVTITLTDVNEAPVVSGDASPSFRENANTAVATYSAADPERETLAWSVDVDTFWISNRGQLHFATPPSYEDGNTSFDVTVTAADAGGLSGSIDVTVTLTDQEEEGTVTLTPPAGWDGTRFAAALSDGDGSTTGLTWQWARSSSRSNWIDIAGATSSTYTAGADDIGSYLQASVSYSDRRSSNKTAEAELTGRIAEAAARSATNTPPGFADSSTTRHVGQGTASGRAVGAPVRATDPDAGDVLTYSLSGSDAADFDIDAATGQLRTRAVLDPQVQDTYSVTVSVSDGFDATYSPSDSQDDSIDVTIVVRAVATVSFAGGGFAGGGGGGGATGPTASDVDFEWNVQRDIEALDSAHGMPSGSWSDGATLWVLENGSGADDAIFAYDLETGERLEDREFALDERNRAPRGIWSDGTTSWVSDSGQDKLFAYDLASGESAEEHEIELDGRNRDPRGIWSDGANMWVADGGKNSLFVYDLPSGELLAEYSLDPANGDPRGIWSDGVTVWVSDHDAKRLFAYQLPVPVQEERAEGEDLPALERVRDEEFTELSGASNNSPRGIWSDGDVMYVVDESDDRVYSYNLPDAIDARLASLMLSGVEIGEFDPGVPEYEGVPGDGVTETTVEAEAAQPEATLAIEPADADEATDGHQLVLEGVSEITVTVTSADESRTKVYRVRFGEAAPSATCLRGAIGEGFSLLVYEGGSLDELEICAQSRHVTALYALHEGEYLSYILGAPEFANEAFSELYAGGVPPLTPLTAKSDGPATADPAAGSVGDGEPWPVCLRGAIGEGFSVVIYEGGSVDALDACARSRGAAAIYALHDGEYVSYILGAPDFVNNSFRELFADGLPAITPLVARSE